MTRTYIYVGEKTGSCFFQRIYTSEGTLKVKVGMMLNMMIIYMCDYLHFGTSLGAGIAQLVVCSARCPA